MKKIYFVFFICLTSCSIIKSSKLVEKQQIILKENPVSFTIKTNRLLVPDVFNFYIDTGAPNIVFSTSSKKLTIIDSLTVGKMTNSNGKVLENKMYVAKNIETNLFSVNNFVFRNLDRQVDCNNAFGLIGPEIFENKIIMLDFQKHIISQINDLKLNDIANYTKAKIKDYDGYYFILEIIIDGKPYEAKFDTGCPYDLILKAEDFNAIKKNNYTSFFKSGDTIENLNISKNEIGFNQTDKDSYFIKSHRFIKRNLIGVSFIKNYNWIIDYKKGNIYFKKIKSNEPHINNERCIIFNKKILLYETVNKASLENLNNQILSVNSIKIGAENICEIQDLLNETEDWSKLKIEFLEFTKK